MIEADGYETVHASGPAQVEPRCPSCGRYARVYPASRDDGSLCGELGFHGFTYGERGTIAQLWHVLERLADDLIKRYDGRYDCVCECSETFTIGPYIENVATRLDASPEVSRQQEGEPRDWSRWLPPKALPGRDSRNARDAAKVGQVYAARWGKEPYQARVWRCDVDGDALLAGHKLYECKAPRSADGGFSYSHAVLVAEPGCEPTPPEVLYGAATCGMPSAGKTPCPHRAGHGPTATCNGKTGDPAKAPAPKPSEASRRAASPSCTTNAGMGGGSSRS
jgi:hypothetical protein